MADSSTTRQQEALAAYKRVSVPILIWCFVKGKYSTMLMQRSFWWHLDNLSQKVKEHEELSERLRKSESKHILLPTLLPLCTMV